MTNHNLIIVNNKFYLKINLNYKNTFQYIYFVTTCFTLNENDGQYVHILNLNQPNYFN